jgi:hypothetical protein
MNCAFWKWEAPARAVAWKEACFGRVSCCRRVTKIFPAAVIAFVGVEGPGPSHATDIRSITIDNAGFVQSAADRTKWKLYLNSNAGIEFVYPSTRKVIVGCHYKKNCIALVGKTTRPADYVVAFEIFNGALDAVAVDQAVFQRVGDDWIAKGRNANHPVEPISGSGWRGLKSIVDCGISDNSGSHPGAGECLWVVMSDGKRSIVVDTQGTAPIDQDTMRSILSLRFRAR